MLQTEFGILDVKPGEIIVIPRGIKFQVALQEDKARGYICENFGAFRYLNWARLVQMVWQIRDFKVPVTSMKNR